MSLHTKAKEEISEKTRDVIILDNGSSMSLFMNRDLVEDIHEGNEVLELITNTGSSLDRKKASVPNF